MELLTINHDVITGKITQTKLTKDQIADREKMAMEANEANLTREAQAQAKIADRQLVLDKLGLTSDEAQLLLG